MGETSAKLANRWAVNFGRNLLRLRKRANLTKTDLARRIGVTRQAVDKWEGGVIPDFHNLVALADGLNASLDDLFGDVWSERPGPTQEEVLAERVVDLLRGQVLTAREDGAKYGITRPVPVVAKVACGIPDDEDLPASTAELILPDQPHLRAIEASGDSLEGKGIYDGDLLLVLPQKFAGQPFGGEMWVVRAAGQGAQVRIVTATGSGEDATVTLSPASSRAKPRTYPAAEVEFLAKVEGVYRKHPERR
ncbi:MAG TPA: helix-turn-helix domain-containing protein [Chloroflexota bacterium]